MSDENALQMLVAFSGVSPEDRVLDVCCGPGLVAAAFAKHARSVEGIDLTPAMIERATGHCAERGLRNVRFRAGDAMQLPCVDRSFTLVLSRFAFHHLEQPQAVLAEMGRVCSKGGRILLVDAVCSDQTSKAAAFNDVERIRDPSHVAYRPLAQLTGWFDSAALPILSVRTFALPLDLESMLARSFPDPGGADKVRAGYAAALDNDAFGVEICRKAGGMQVTYPAIALLARKP